MSYDFSSYELVRSGVTQGVVAPMGYNNELVLSTRTLLRPTLTVELSTKWYELFLVTTNFSVYAVHFGYLESAAATAGVSAFVDHTPNPMVVRSFAARNDYELDELADNLIHGRWQTEVVEIEDMECDRCEGAGVIPRIETGGVMWRQTCRKCKGKGWTGPHYG